LATTSPASREISAPSAAQAAEVDVDRAVADGAPARHGDARVPAPRQQGAQHAHAGAHGAHDVVPGVAVFAGGGAYADLAPRIGGAGLVAGGHAGVGDLAAQLFEQAAHVGDVRQVRYGAQGDLIVGQQGGGELGEGGVLAAVDPDAA
jgi:hypothetical protein